MWTLVASAVCFCCLVQSTYAQFSFCKAYYGGSCYAGQACPTGTSEIANPHICPVDSVCCTGSVTACYANSGNDCASGQCDAVSGTCVCDLGFSGDLCELSVCSPDPCQNGGICTPDQQAVNGYVCTCDTAGTYGDNCELQACPSNHQCFAGHGTCTPIKIADSTNGYAYTCTCDVSYSGDFCQIGSCDNNPCGLNGVCSTSGTDPFYACQCNLGYSGNDCEVENCAGKCNGQTCVGGVAASYDCQCNVGFDVATDCAEQEIVDCGVPPVIRRILMGSSAQSAEAPWAVHILLNGITIGSGTLVRPSVDHYKMGYMVITSPEVCAYCDSANVECTVKSGDTIIGTSESGEQDATVVEMSLTVPNIAISYQTFYDATDEDILKTGVCMMKLNTRLLAETGITAPLCAPTTDPVIDCYVAAYGQTGTDGNSPAINKMKLKVELVQSQCVCAKLREKQTVEEMASSVRCAVPCNQPELKGVCLKDNGGPVYCKSTVDQKYHLQGIVTLKTPFYKSGPSEYCNTGSFIYTDAAEFWDIIDAEFAQISP